jgi:bla regulator protein BlaR1
MTPEILIGLAYNLPPVSKAQIVGGPEWIDKTSYRIEAKIDQPTYAAMLKMSPAQRTEQIRLMEQSLLSERFGLKVHFEGREQPGYRLVVAKGGPKLTPTKSEPESAGSGATHPPADKGFSVVGKADEFEMKANGLSLHDLAPFIQQQPELAGRLVIDQTGLDDTYNFTMTWTREEAARTSDNYSASGNAPPFFIALKDQLGLQLLPTKASAEVIVIDHIAKPSDN